MPKKIPQDQPPQLILPSPPEEGDALYRTQDALAKMTERHRLLIRALDKIVFGYPNYDPKKRADEALEADAKFEVEK